MASMRESEQSVTSCELAQVWSVTHDGAADRQRQSPLDYETKKAYTFKVEASNAHLDSRFQSFGAFKDMATVKINVLDVDEPPVFNKPSYLMDVYEDTPAGTIIGAVTAQDLDATSSPVR
ncbi:Cadherin-12 [Crenichthys baileyi]|uniref:Cadherin-12 n=1 Tax=Crenichthys baileyi TaxID=28760 RepID=A0AAV9SPE4_9TELE